MFHFTENNKPSLNISKNNHNDVDI
jgi:hypothetical protein